MRRRFGGSHGHANAFAAALNNHAEIPTCQSSTISAITPARIAPAKNRTTPPRRQATKPGIITRASMGRR